MGSRPPLDRIRLYWSITTTCSGLRPSTLAASRLTMAWVFSSGRILVPLSFSSTEALASSFSVTKGLSLLGEMCTVAWATCWMDMMVLASSPSMARRYITFWVKSVVVRLGDSSFSKPMPSPLGRPSPANWSRRSPTRASGTETVRWSWLSSYLMLVFFSSSTIRLASVGGRLVNRTPMDSWLAHRPKPTSTRTAVRAMAATMPFWVLDMSLRVCWIWAERLVSSAMVSFRWPAAYALHLHLHHCAVGIDQLRSNGHHHLETDISLLDRQNSRVHVSSIPTYQVPCLLFGSGPGSVHFLQRLLQEVAERGAVRGALAGGSP